MTVADLDDLRPLPKPDAPPLPRLKGRPVVGLLPALRRDPLTFFVETARDHGDVVELDLGLHRALMFNHPRYIRHVLQDNHRNYTKSKFYRPLKPMIGGGIFLAEGDDWLAQRRTTGKGFQGCCLKQMVSGMTEATAALIAEWRHRKERDQPLDVVPEMMRLTLDIVLRSLLSVRLDGEHSRIFHALTRALRDAERRVWSLATLPPWVPTPHNLECRRAHQAIDDFVAGIIRARRADPGEHGDFLQIVMDAHAEQQRQLPPAARSDKPLHDQIRSFILAGHETTANAMAWAWYLLSTHPEIARRVRAEARRVLGGRAPAFEDLGRLSYSRMVFDEVLRLYPPVWTISRAAIADDRVGDIVIPKGTSVMLCTYAVHRRPELWRNPEGFDPERFAPGSPEAEQRYAYFPFAEGPRKCLGARFSVIEGLIIMAMISQAFELDLVPGQTIRPEPMITLRPHGQVLMRLRDA